MSGRDIDQHTTELRSVVHALTIAFIASVTACTAFETTATRESAGHFALPDPSSASPWGGPDESRWSVEAVLANAASCAINTVTDPNAVDVRVAIPIQIRNSSYHPFPDGQTNAWVVLPWWVHPRPPVVATRVAMGDGSWRIEVRVDREVPQFPNSVSVKWKDALGADQSATVAVESDSDKDRLAHIDSGAIEFASLDLNSRLEIYPDGWADHFSISFRIPIASIDAFAATVPGPLTLFQDGKPIRDPLSVASATTTAYENLTAMTDLPGNYNDTAYPLDDVHGHLPDGRDGHMHVETTAVGRGWSWVAEPPYSPFKSLYACFERRRADLEAAALPKAVPSGAGWHRIGDPGETLLHSLEGEPILIGYAEHDVQEPVGRAYGLFDFAVFRQLRPGEAFTVGGSTDSVSRFHWYAIHHAREVCAEIWVHPCAPVNADIASFACQ